jgi:GNAT superfamily N-acetyltransferase
MEQNKLNYKIIPYDDQDKVAFCEFYNREAPKYSYKPLSSHDFDTFIFHHPEFDSSLFYLVKDELNRVIGALLCVIRKIEKDDEKYPMYLALLLVDEKLQNKGIGKSLMNLAYEVAQTRNKTSVVISYRSTLNLPWLIPSFPTHDHPGAPGAMVNSKLYLFLCREGFEPIDEEDSFHIDLTTFEMSDKAKKLEQKMKDNAITIELYDEKKHFGIPSFYEEIQDEAFERVIRENLARNNPYPFLVVSQNGKVEGWTGAFYTEESGRQHFDGICISPIVRGFGVGTVLFQHLLDYGKTHGSSFMSFFTGRTNFARKIYREAGGKITMSFAVMKKELKK